jgi:hypothetical protein
MSAVVIYLFMHAQNQKGTPFFTFYSREAKLDRPARVGRVIFHFPMRGDLIKRNEWTVLFKSVWESFDFVPEKTKREKSTGQQYAPDNPTKNGGRFRTKVPMPR